MRSPTRTAAVLASAPLLLAAPACRGPEQAKPAPTSSTATTTGVPTTVAPRTGDGSALPGAAAPPAQVRITDYDFEPVDLDVEAGATVTWTNVDPIEHQIVSLDPGVLQSPRLAEGAAYSHTFERAGTYRYYCTIHNLMKGTVTVR
ncbi:MAG: plastocyanin/azurin family copper-binding protein [Acidimicrobiales bacterium]|jgi:plastocyanin|nr:plastocyanin/azurin family copper-binding protein [Acidimicrobiales bacterium]